MARKDATQENEGQLPAKSSNVKAFKTFVWNPETKQFIGRTGKSWALIGLFYLIYYSCLAAFWGTCLYVFLVTLSTNAPRLQKKETILKDYPGMGFRPQPRFESTLIQFSAQEASSYKRYVDDLNGFFGPYINQTGDDLVDCNGLVKPPVGKICYFNTSLLGTACTEQTSYGFPSGQPCILLKLNKIYDWIPSTYINDSACPEAIHGQCLEDYVKITCEGENYGDIDVAGPIEFFPPEGYHRMYYPYLNQENYRQPVVFAQFTNPRNGTLFQIWCKAWANNIYHHKNDRAGSVHFEILIDS